MNSDWEYFKTVSDGEYCGVDGINIWDYKWKFDSETVIVNDPIYKEPKSLNRFWIELANRRVEFVAGEFSMSVWGIYIRKDYLKETKNSLKLKSKIAREITNELDLLGFIANGAPEDEYDPLSARILSDIINKKENKEIIENAFELLTDYYGIETVQSKIVDFKVEIEKLSKKIREKTYAN